MKKQTTVKVTAMTKGTLRWVSKQDRWSESCNVKEEKLKDSEKHTDLEGPWVVGEAVSMDEHAQGCQGDEEPAWKRGKVDELVDFPSD